MSTITSTIPYLYSYSESEEAAAPAAPARAGLSFVAVAVGLFLLTSNAPDVGVVPANEIVPLSDANADLGLQQIVQRFESRLGAARKKEAYRLGKLVLELSERHQISPSLILAVIDTESSYRFEVVSKAGAVGLMQLEPETAAEVARLYHVRSYKSPEDLADPAVNLRLGVAYLAYLRHQFGNSLHYLAAYNAGPTAFRKRLRGGNFELGALDSYVRTIHQRARAISDGQRKQKRSWRGLAREQALMAASI